MKRILLGILATCFYTTAQAIVFECGFLQGESRMERKNYVYCFSNFTDERGGKGLSCNQDDKVRQIEEIPDFRADTETGVVKWTMEKSFARAFKKTIIELEKENGASDEEAKARADRVDKYSDSSELLDYQSRFETQTVDSISGKYLDILKAVPAHSLVFGDGFRTYQLYYSELTDQAFLTQFSSTDGAVTSTNMDIRSGKCRIIR